jgi:hypothetical protein
MDVTSPQPIDTSQDIHCPLCDYNLRGLAEARCPECGGQFNWADLRNPAKRLHPYLFEHHPERNLWSFARTLIGGFTPRRFWAELLPQQPSKVRRIVLYSLIYSALLFAVCAIQFVGDCLEYKTMISVQRAQTLSELTGRTTGIRPGARWTSVHDALGQIWLRAKLYYQNGGYPGAMDDNEVRGIIVQYGSINRYLDDLYPPPPSPRFFRDVFIYTEGRRSYGDEGVYLHVLVLILFWPWLTVAALMIFQITLRRFRLRASHLVRVAIYSGDIFFWLGCALLVPMLLDLTETGISKSGTYRLHLWQDTIRMMVLYGFAIAWLIFSIRIWIACRKYLQFDHALATIISTQIIVVLAAVKLLMVWENGHWM